MAESIWLVDHLLGNQTKPTWKPEIASKHDFSLSLISEDAMYGLNFSIFSSLLVLCNDQSQVLPTEEAITQGGGRRHWCLVGSLLPRLIRTQDMARIFPTLGQKDRIDPRCPISDVT